MSRCAVCAVPLTGRRRGLCSFHEGGWGRDWAAENRILCDFVHRGMAPQRLPAEERSRGLHAPEAEDLELRPDRFDERRQR